MGARLKTREEIDASIGVGPSTTPAPGGNTRVPSFAWEHRDKGVEFGHKLASPRTILLVRVKGLWVVSLALITVSLCAANWVPPATRYVAVAHHAWCTCADVCVYVRLPAQRREATARCRASRRRTSGSGRESYSGGESNRRAPFFKTLGIPCHQASRNLTSCVFERKTHVGSRFVQHLAETARCPVLLRTASSKTRACRSAGG